MKTASVALALLFGICLAMVSACGGGEADPTAREISDDELALMVLALEDFGSEFGDFQAWEGNGLLTLDQAAEDDFDPADERADLERFGWASGYQEFYSNPQGTERRADVFFLGSSVNLFNTAEGAAGYFEDSRAESLDQPGRTSKGITAEQIQYSNADVADEAAGVVGSFRVEGQEGSEVRFWVSGVSFRRGRLVGSVAVYSVEEQHFQDRLKNLAHELERQISSILAATGSAPRLSDKYTVQQAAGGQ